MPPATDAELGDEPLIDEEQRSAARAIDWRAFDAHPESTCFCRCEAVYRSHAKIVMEPSPHVVARKACPACGRTDNLRRVSSDREVMTIRR